MYAVIFDLFIKLTDELEEADNFLIEDENEKIHVKDAADHIVNSAEIEEKIKKIWGVNQDREKIGKKIIKPAFPFINFNNYKKKILLIRQ